MNTWIGTASTLAEQYREKGLQALYDCPRSGRPIQIDGEQCAKITALACSTPPEGHAKWSLRLLADKAVEIDFCEQISHTHVRTIQKNELKPHLQQSWCIGRLDSRFCQAIAAKYPNAIKIRMVSVVARNHPRILEAGRHP